MDLINIDSCYTPAAREIFHYKPSFNVYFSVSLRGPPLKGVFSYISRFKTDFRINFNYKIVIFSGKIRESIFFNVNAIFIKDRLV